MKIKLMIVSLVVVVALQGSERILTLEDALYKRCWLNGDGKKHTTVILHSGQIFTNIVKALDTDTMKFYMANNGIHNVMIVSDTSTQNREIADIELGKKMTREQQPYYSENIINQLTEFKFSNDHDNFIEFLAKDYKGAVILNIHHGDGGSKMSLFLREIPTILHNENVSLLVIVGPNYDGIDMGKFCEDNAVKPHDGNIENAVNPIVFNKPETEIFVWCKKHCFVLGGASLIALLGVMYRYRHMFIKS